MARIVTTHYCYKRPARKRKPIALEAPAVVTTKISRRLPVGGPKETAAKAQRAPVQEGTPREAARAIAAPPANDDRKPMKAMKPTIITTISRKQHREADRPHLPMDLPLFRQPGRA